MPLDRGIIDQQLENLGEGSRWWNVRELRDLPTVLHEDEHIHAIARGKMGRPRWLRHNWLIVLTERRLLCLRSSKAPSWQQLELPIGAVVRVSLRIGPFRGRVAVVTAGQTFRLLLPRTDAYRLQSTLAGMVQPGKALVAGFAPGRMARRVIDHVFALPAAALDPRPPQERPAAPPGPDHSALQRQVQVLEDQLHMLQQQVDFLEDLLQRSSRNRLPGDTSGGPRQLPGETAPSESGTA